MVDDLKRNRLKTLPKMYDRKCPCCNWTLVGNKKKNIRLVRKQSRAKLRANLISLEDEFYEANNLVTKENLENNL